MTPKEKGKKRSVPKSDYEELIRRAQEQPGVAELMEAYGKYAEAMSSLEEYFYAMRPKAISSTTDRTC